MEFWILGPLEAHADGRKLELSGGKQRALLALLLLHRNEDVSTERIVDELWGERPPATAAKIVQNYVSRLRRSLAADSDGDSDGPLLTQGHGYQLRVEEGALDLDRFERLLEDGRRALADGDAQHAESELRRSLDLWRGPPLADVAFEPFAQPEIARLEERRLTAVEERVDASLALGRHGDLVAELQTLVAEHPLRERLRAQLMLALYRCGRQGEALQAYQDTRRTLVEELGIEPGPELKQLHQQILNHDGSLAAPPRVEPERRGLLAAPVRRRPHLLLLAGGLLLVTAAALAAFLTLRGGDATLTAVAPNAVATIDPSTNAITARIPVGRSPTSVAVGDGAVWVLNADDRTVSQIDPRTRSVVRTFSTSSTPTGLAAGAGGVWIGNGFRGSGFANTSYPASVSRVDPESGVVDRAIDLPRPSTRAYFQGGIVRNLIAVTRDAVWVVNADQTVSRIDPRTGRIVARVSGTRASGIAAGADGVVWIIDEQGVARIDPTTNRISRRIPVAAKSLEALAVGADALWAADPFGGSVWRIDIGPRVVLRTIPLEFGVGSVALGEGAVWAANEVSNKVHRIDPRTNRARLVGGLPAPGGVAVGAGAVWVTAAGASGDEGPQASACGKVFYEGAGEPRLLFVSDLPLQGPARTLTVPMVEAIRHTLERRGFRAGPYSVGYQACDDSTAQAGGTDIYRCFSNAKAYARAESVIGVIGAFHSFCSAFQIPILNQALGGPVAMISPSNTVTGLTRRSRSDDPNELQKIYPSGTRNYVRIAAADHLSAIAQAELAKELGVTRLSVLYDGNDSDMVGFVADLRAAARRRGLEIAGAAPWRPDARSFSGLARSVAAGRPDGVLLAGAAPPRASALLRDLRAALGSEIPLIAGDGFWGAGGAAADGMYRTNYGIPNSALPRRGKQFLRRFEAARGDAGPDFSAAYAAQAAEILLDAIARSDGTRASVTRELRRAKVKDGILGDIEFDRNGDLVEGPVTVFRVVGRPSAYPASEGAVVDRVIKARAPVGPPPDDSR